MHNRIAVGQDIGESILEMMWKVSVSYDQDHWKRILKDRSALDTGTRSIECSSSYYYSFANQTKPRAWKLSKLLNNGFSFGVRHVEEEDRITTLQGYGQALKQEDGVLGDKVG